MGVNNENHRESPHRINILYPFFCHNYCKGKKKLRIEN